MKNLLIVKYMDGARDVLELNDSSPNVFVTDNGTVLNVHGRLIVKYMDGARDVLELNDSSPNVFVTDNGTVLNVHGRYTMAVDYNWFYFPMCNIKNYETRKGETA